MTTPAYLGPTTAERFMDDMAAVRALARHGLTAPVELTIPAIIARYPATSVETDDEMLPLSIIFMDDSTTRRNRRGRWV